MHGYRRGVREVCRSASNRGSCAVRGQSVQEAAQAALDDVAARRGDGGVIVMPASGDGVIAYNSETMNYGYVTADGVRVVHGAE